MTMLGVTRDSKGPLQHAEAETRAKREEMLDTNLIPSESAC